MFSFDELKKQRAAVAIAIDFRPLFNYIGSESLPFWLKYPWFFPFYKYLLFPAANHDHRYEKLDRNSSSNKLMFRDFAVEMLLDDVDPWSLYFWAGLTWFIFIIAPFIWTIGRAIDYGHKLKEMIEGFRK